MPFVGEAPTEQLDELVATESHHSSDHGSQTRNDTLKDWSVFGSRVPKQEIVFFRQIVIIYTVICVSIFNLTRGHGQSDLWTALLSSSLGYLLPNPKIRKS
jgi:hypothetical protein